MTNAKIKRVLVKAFKALTKLQKKRLLEHVKMSTPILFGDDADSYKKGDAA